MTKYIGNILPESIFSSISADIIKRENTAIFILTQDSNGYPHVAMLSPYQFSAISREQFIFSIYPSSESCSNLRDRKKSTFIFQMDGGVYYVKSQVEEIKENPFLNASHSVFISSGLWVGFDHSERALITSYTRFQDAGVIEDYRREAENLIRISKNLVKGN
jgi:hypothetical protein